MANTRTVEARSSRPWHRSASSRRPAPAWVAPRPPTRIVTPAKVVTALGALLLVVGAFLPWTRVTIGFSTFAFSGVEGGNSDGWVMLAAGVVALAAICIPWSKARGAVAMIVGGVAAWVSISELLRVRGDINRIKALATDLAPHTVIGLGLWSCAIGSVLVVAAGFFMLVEKRA